MTQAISWLFLLYFAILFGERTQSIIRTAREGLMVHGGFDTYVNFVTVASLLATVLVLATVNAGFWRSLVDGKTPDYGRLALAAGVLLVAGMVHTHYTVSPVQFGAYGMLIFAMILRCVQANGACENRVAMWYSLVYLTVFSMAIPVMYQAGIPHAGVFHVIEAITALTLVAMFAWMLRTLFVAPGSDLLTWPPVLVMAIADAVIVAMRWKESRNLFVLIFAVLAVLLFAIGKPLLKLRPLSGNF